MKFFPKWRRERQNKPTVAQQKQKNFFALPVELN